MKSLQLPAIDPYRILFPIGVLHGMIGVGMWIILFSSRSSLAPVVPHPEIMIGGFLSAFALGFLMTALPRLTRTRTASRNELGLIVCLFVILFVASFTSLLLFRVTSLSIYLFLIVFASRRFRRSQVLLPPYFYFVAFGLLSTIVGNVLLVLSMFILQDFVALTKLARVLYLQATMLNFAVGIGSFLIPALLGHGPLPLSSGFTAQLSHSRFTRVPLLLAIGFNTSIWLDAIYANDVTRFSRAAFFALLALGVWRIARYPAIRGYLQFGVWISCWSFLLSQVALAFFYEYASHVLHLMYISGFSLLTFLVASRVTLAHGHGKLEFERTSELLGWTIFMLLSATIIRLLAIVVPSFGPLNTLKLGASVWLIGVFLWVIFFVRNQKSYAKKSA